MRYKRKVSLNQFFHSSFLTWISSQWCCTNKLHPNYYETRTEAVIMQTMGGKKCVHFLKVKHLRVCDWLQAIIHSPVAITTHETTHEVRCNDDSCLAIVFPLWPTSIVLVRVIVYFGIATVLLSINSDMQIMVVLYKHAHVAKLTLTKKYVSILPSISTIN